jgi:hypothetical protein
MLLCRFQEIPFENSGNVYIQETQKIKTPVI